MEISKALELRQRLQQDILELLRDFNSTTGLTPNAIDLEIGNYTRLMNSRKASLIDAVHVRIQI